MVRAATISFVAKFIFRPMELVRGGSYFSSDQQRGRLELSSCVDVGYGRQMLYYWILGNG